MKRLTTELRDRRDLLLMIAAALAIAFVTRPTAYLAPEAWTEASWQSAIHTAFKDGLNFGGDTGIYFTYGPLGFLQLPTYWYGLTGALAVLSRLAELALLAFLLIVILRKRVGTGWALGLTFALMSLQATVVYHPPLPIAAFVAALYVLTDPRPELQRMLAIAGGILAGYGALGRVNSGVIVLAVIVCALAFLDGRRSNVPIAIGGAVATFLLGWMLTGNALPDLPGYFAGTASMVGGYSETMAVEQSGLGWQYAAAALLIAAGVVGAVVTGRREGGDVRVAMACTWLLFSFLVFKQGFVRHDFHALYFVQAMVIGLAVFPWPLPKYKYALAGGVFAGVVLFAISSDHSLRDTFNYPERIRSHGHALLLVVDSGRRADKIAAGNSDILERRNISPRIAEKLRSAPSTAWPGELAVVRAAEGQLRPLPSLQAYAAYSAPLDRKNAQALRDDGAAPTYILYVPEVEFDRKLFTLDSPAAAREMLCRYRVDGPVTPTEALLKRTRDRCTEPPRKLKTVDAAWGEQVAVPAPSGDNSYVYADIEGVQVSGLERLRTQLFKAYERNIDFSPNPLNPGMNRHYRLNAANAGEGVLLRSGPAADLPGTLAFAPQTTSMKITREHQPSDGQPLRITFYEQQVGS